MTITENAKEILLEVIKNNGVDALSMYTQASCSGNSLGFNLAQSTEDSKPEMIDGVPVFMNDETRAWTGDVIIDAQNGQLTLINPNATGCAGCAGGCH
ncbi:MAG: hypothetical protein R3Y09_00355 [Clostridia bacterium]